jgi:hypothetical protein
MTKDIGTLFNFAIFDWRTIIYALSIGPLSFQTNNCRGCGLPGNSAPADVPIYKREGKKQWLG